MLELSVQKSKVEKKRIFKIEEYPQSKENKVKKVIRERFIAVYGEEYLQRIYEDGAGELTRYNEITESWVLLKFPATVDENIESKIRSVIRNNFDVGVCLPQDKGRKTAI